MNMKRTLVFCLVLAFVCAVTVADARVPIGTLAGTVLDAHGRVVTHAAVTIQTSDGMKPFATHTDQEGHFHIARLITGQYDVRASSGGRISEWTKRVMVHANKTTQVTLRLPPENKP